MRHSRPYGMRMSVESLKQNVTAARQRGDPVQLADALVALATELVPNGLVREARDALDEAAAIHNAGRRSEDERHCRQFSATLSRLSGDRAGARQRASRAAELSPPGSPGAVSAAAELGEIALAESDATAAASAFRQSLEHAESVNLLPSDRAGLLRKLGAALAAKGEVTEASAVLREAESLLERAGESVNALRAAIEAVTALQNAGQHEQASKARRRAFNRARELNDPLALADLELLESSAALDQRDADAAMAAAVRARDHSLRANAPVNYISAVLAIAELADHGGDKLAAYGALAAGYVTLDDLLGAGAGRETFTPRLGALRQKWGADVFQKVKEQYEAERRAAMKRTGESGG